MVSSRQDSAALFATVQAIKAGLEERGIQYEEISGRPKNLYGIWQKMNTNNATNVDKVRIRPLKDTNPLVVHNQRAVQNGYVSSRRHKTALRHDKKLFRHCTEPHCYVL
jgi:hypothetical protein